MGRSNRSGRDLFYEGNIASFVSTGKTMSQREEDEKIMSLAEKAFVEEYGDFMQGDNAILDSVSIYDGDCELLGTDIAFRVHICMNEERDIYLALYSSVSEEMDWILEEYEDTVYTGKPLYHLCQAAEKWTDKIRGRGLPTRVFAIAPILA